LSDVDVGFDAEPGDDSDAEPVAELDAESDDGFVV
jgi:hypothetical protein